jgi:hypothetical protein
MRGFIARELLKTEETYVTGLKTLVQVYVNQLRTRAMQGEPVVSDAELRQIFSDVEPIRTMHAAPPRHSRPRAFLSGLAIDLLRDIDGTSL